MIRKVGLGLLSVGLLGSAVGDLNLDKQVDKVAVASTVTESQRYLLETDSTNLGYEVGMESIFGTKVVGVSDVTKSSFSELSKSSDLDLYTKATNSRNMNYILTPISGGNLLTPLRVNKYVKDRFNSPTTTYINSSVLQYEFTKLLNAERVRLGVAPLKYSAKLQKGVDLRASELASIGDIRVNGVSHARLDGSRYYTAYNGIVPYPYVQIGENLTMFYINGNPYQILSEKYLAEQAYKNWKASSGHYALMTNSKYKTFALSIKVSGNNKYNPYQDGVVAATGFSITDY